MECLCARVATKHATMHRWCSLSLDGPLGPSGLLSVRRGAFEGSSFTVPKASKAARGLIPQSSPKYLGR